MRTLQYINFHLGHNPEVLTLAHLTWEHGLPAGVHEIHIINRMRIKRAWEAILPPLDTPANIKMRNSIITALEIDEWAFRESVSISKHKEEFQSFICIYIYIYISFFFNYIINKYDKTLNPIT